MDRNDLQQQTLNGILKDLGDLGYQLTSTATDAIKGRLVMALAKSYGSGWQAACLEMLSHLKPPHSVSNQP